MRLMKIVDRISDVYPSMVGTVVREDIRRTGDTGVEFSRCDADRIMNTDGCCMHNLGGRIYANRGWFIYHSALKLVKEGPDVKRRRRDGGISSWFAR